MTNNRTLVCRKLPAITTVKEYLSDHAVRDRYTLLEGEVRETEKAVAFSAVGFTVYGNPCRKIAWFPKSRIVRLMNDHYTNEAPDHMWLVPMWLIDAKRGEGLDLLEKVG